jgi:lipoprotein-anchoring transpeptidase ErfK/SrfK
MTETSLTISISGQWLELSAGDGSVRRYAVSTSRYGAGERNGSLQTPRGRHRIRARIGAGCPVGTVFVGRRATGEIYDPALGRAHPDRDWILTRILWLCGQEPGRNRFGDVDTMRRYIYIHGMPDSEPCGVPGSIGCIRMRNADLVELFDRVAVGTPVLLA